MPTTFHAHDARTGAPLPDPFPEATAADVQDAVAAARAAAPTLAALDLPARAELLETIADALEDAGAALIARADLETALGAARFTGELARTTGQLRAFADVVREGAHLGVVIDHADPTAVPPRPDLRRTGVPVGVVAVFGASNFPLAFGVAGGDTASALAAGCPVVAKAHPSNAGTSALVAAAVRGAVARLGLPAGTFTLLQGAGHEVGAALVTHPDVRSVGFTGSLAGGRAIADLAAARPEPIPVHAEMGSHNPVWITPLALARRGPSIAAALAASATLGVGQFCTKPSVVFLPSDPTDVDLAARSDAFVTTLGEGVATASIGPMLDARISARYAQRRAALRALPGLTDVTDASRSTDANGTAGGTGASVLTCDLTTWQAEAELREECFGPLIIVVRCPPAALVDAVATVPGGLTASVWSEPDDEGELELARALVTAVTDRVGRVLHDGMPTGVAVTWAQQHGGPYPATTSPGTTSVGMHAVDRFLRPVAYQDVPAALLPVWLRDDDPWSLPRRVDGRLTLPR
jgi:acyl-CoA reductase-like NAD-dependent aldehyde dehydrogenase